MKTLISAVFVFGLVSCSKPEAPAPVPEKAANSAVPVAPAPQPSATPASGNRTMPAKEAADKLIEAGILANCKEQVPKGANARASEYFNCELPSVPGEGAGVMTHETDDAYEATVKTYEGFALMAGSHRYGNPKVRIFVQLNKDASLEVGKKTKALVASF